MTDLHQMRSLYLISIQTSERTVHNGSLRLMIVDTSKKMTKIIFPRLTTLSIFFLFKNCFFDLCLIC